MRGFVAELLYTAKVTLDVLENLAISLTTNMSSKIVY